MNFLLKTLFIVLNYFVFVPNPNINFLFTYAADSVELNLDQELKQGNILLGIKQYIGREGNEIVDNQFLIFTTKNQLIELESANGINHKSNELRIILKKVLLDSPVIIKRFVVGPFASYESAFKQSVILQGFGYESQVAYPSDWEVWLPYETNFIEENNFQLQIIRNDYELVPFLENDYISQKLEGPISIISKEDIKINNKNYGRYFFLVKDSYGSWTLVQKIAFDDYLKGVLPHEIGANSPLEALKAQAVIARTWAFYNSNRFEIDSYHLCITTQCQVYEPISSPGENIIRAISETSNLILTFDGQPINAFYHASNGGISATASESWQMDDYFYFQPQFDFRGDDQIFFNIPLDKDNKLEEFLAINRNNFFGKDHYLFRWEKVISNEYLKQILLNLQLIKSESIVVSVEILERGLSGRVTKLRIILKKPSQEIIVLKDDIRKMFSFLPSNLFIIDKKDDDLWNFKGGGFGHGVGLSQSGAIEMAENGFSFERILDHYYQGTNIMNIEELKY